MQYLFLFIIPFTILAQSGYDIAKMVDNRPMPNDLSNHAKMVLTNSKGKSRYQTMLSKSIDQNKRQIIWFLEPKDDRGISFLKIQYKNKDDVMRMWLPAFKRVRRISAKKRGDAFMGSDLSYEDLSSRELSENEYRRIDDDNISGVECYVIEIIPNEEIKSFYQKHISWIDKTNFTILQEHSFNRKGELEKKKEYRYTLIKEYQIIDRIFVTNNIKNHTTEVIFSNIEVDNGIEDALFKEKSLKYLPYLK